VARRHGRHKAPLGARPRHPRQSDRFTTNNKLVAARKKENPPSWEILHQSRRALLLPLPQMLLERRRPYAAPHPSEHLSLRRVHIRSSRGDSQKRGEDSQGRWKFNGPCPTMKLRLCFFRRLSLLPSPRPFRRIVHRHRIALLASNPPLGV
jgi:hypothetical protein